MSTDLHIVNQLVPLLTYGIIIRETEKIASNNGNCLGNCILYVFRVAKYHKKSFQQLTILFMSAWWGDSKNMQEIEFSRWLFEDRPRQSKNVLQLDKYETAPNFIFKPKTWHEIVCWFSWIYLFLPVLAWAAH